jgi:sterol desaturase/sphingolipid hydroxylase (fatty acid hydroxylase superfamily)
MRLSKPVYYADFITYPAIVAGMTAYALVGARVEERLAFLASGALGGLLWTLVEYVLHRFLLHHAPILAAMHETHHDDPLDLIGTPTWATFPIVCGVLLSSSLLMGAQAGIGLTAGLLGGYIWYSAVHHATHHGRLYGSRYLYRARRRHAVHHNCETGNFGVTTEFWDHVFGTVALGGNASAARPPDRPAHPRAE